MAEIAECIGLFIGLTGESMLPSTLGALSRRDRPGDSDLSSADVLFASDMVIEGGPSGDLLMLFLPFPLAAGSSAVTGDGRVESLNAFTLTGAIAAIGFAPKLDILWRLEDFELAMVGRLVVDDALADRGC